MPDWASRWLLMLRPLEALQPPTEVFSQGDDQLIMTMVVFLQVPKSKRKHFLSGWMSDKNKIIKDECSTVDLIDQLDARKTA